MNSLKEDIDDVLNAASRGRQLTALLENIYQKGVNELAPDNELIGLAYDLCSKLSLFLDQLEVEDDK